MDHPPPGLLRDLFFCLYRNWRRPAAENQLLATSTLDRRSIGGKQTSECIYANHAASGFGLVCFLQYDVALAKLATLMFNCLAGNEKMNTDVGTLVGFPPACELP